MSMRYILIFGAFLSLVLLFSGCSKESAETEETIESNNTTSDSQKEIDSVMEDNYENKDDLESDLIVSEVVPEYRKISAEEAYAMMSDEGIVILDVRTEEEYAGGHIKDSVLLPHSDVTANIESLYPDKNTTFLVYCRSGNRSRQASDMMVELGYTNVYDFGGIIDWPYEVVTD